MQAIDTFENVNTNIEITLNDIEHAISVLVTAYAKQRKNFVGIRNIWSPGPVPLSEIPLGKQAELLSLCEDPLRHALWEAIASLAHHLNEFYGKETGHLDNWAKMADSLDRIVSMSEGDETALEVYLDKIFDGIGGWTA